MHQVILLSTIIGALGVIYLALSLFVRPMGHFLGLLCGAQLRHSCGMGDGVRLSLLSGESGGAMSAIVGYCSSSLVTLQQGVALMLGSNIGGLVVLLVVGLVSVFIGDLEVVDMLLLSLGAVLWLVRWRMGARMAVGLSLLIIGEVWLLGAVSDFATSYLYFSDFRELVSHGYLSWGLLCVVGVLLGYVAGGISVVYILGLSFVVMGLLPLSGAMALMLGASVGLTMVGHRAAMGGSVNAKRVATAQTIVQAWGALWCLVLMPWIFGEWMVYLEAVPLALILVLFYVAYQVVNLFLFRGLIGVVMRMVFAIFPSQEGSMGRRLRPSRGYVPSELLLIQARAEVSAHGRRLFKMFGFLESLHNATENEQVIMFKERIVKYEEITDKVQSEIIEFTCGISSFDGNAQREVVERISALEQVADSIFLLSSTLEAGRGVFSDQQQATLAELLGLLRDILHKMSVGKGNELEVKELIQRCEVLRFSESTLGEATTPTSGILFAQALVECAHMAKGAKM